MGIQSRLVRELEKKFSGKHVVIIGQRRIMRKPSAGQRQPKQKRPRSRTLTAVHESILEDLVYTTEIVGKHTRHRLDGSNLQGVLGPQRGSERRIQSGYICDGVQEADWQGSEIRVSDRGESLTSVAWCRAAALRRDQVTIIPCQLSYMQSSG